MERKHFQKLSGKMRWVALIRHQLSGSSLLVRSFVNRDLVKTLTKCFQDLGTFLDKILGKYGQHLQHFMQFFASSAIYCEFCNMASNFSVQARISLNLKTLHEIKKFFFSQWIACNIASSAVFHTILQVLQYCVQYCKITSWALTDRNENLE